MSNGSAVRVLTEGQTHTHTDTQTDGTVLITSTADAGGKKSALHGLILADCGIISNTTSTMLVKRNATLN